MMADAALDPYVARARALLDRGRADAPASDWHARVSQVADKMLLAMISLTASPQGTESDPSLRPETSPWAPFAERALREPLAFFPPPDSPRISARRHAELADGVIEDLTFPTYYPADRPPALELLRRYPENATAHVRRYRHRAEGRPAVICLHGWRGGLPHLEAAIFRARWLYEELGLDVYLYVHPYHGARRPMSAPPAVSLHPSASITRTNEAFLQTAWEVRALVRHHRERTGAGAGLLGVSLGGYATALLASVAPEIGFAIPILPLADLVALMWSWANDEQRAESERRGLTFDAHCRLMHVHAPLAHHLLLPRDRVLLIAGRGDRITPPEHASALWEHWGRPAIHWFAGGHLLHFGRAGYWDAVQSFLRRLPAGVIGRSS